MPRAPRIGRTIVLAALGAIGLFGLSAGAYSMLSGLAGPPAAKPRIGRIAADWPDLKDGVPALAPAAAPATPRAWEAPRPSASAAEPVLRSASDAASADSVAARTRVSPRLLPIENATLVPARTIVALVSASRGAALVGPLPGESIRARAAAATFAALPPEPIARDAAATPRRKASVPATARAKPAPVAVGAGVAASEPPQESEETEVFGIKVPSLAPAGRKFVEGVEAFGKAVKDQF